MYQSIDIITDGACAGNPGRGGWAAIVVAAGQISEYAGSVAQTTNNRMELTAALNGLMQAPPAQAINLYTDSQYLINGITKWVVGWQKNGWKTRDGHDVENQDLWQQLLGYRAAHVSWHYVKGHNGHTLNERANLLAQQQAGSQHQHSRTPHTQSDAGFPVYLSLVGGQLGQHRTWEACKAVVHGVSGAKFKKVNSAHERRATLTSWGLPGE
jgi:ribonuclease HI